MIPDAVNTLETFPVALSDHLLLNASTLPPRSEQRLGHRERDPSVLIGDDLSAAVSGHSEFREGSAAIAVFLFPPLSEPLGCRTPKVSGDESIFLATDLCPYPLRPGDASHPCV